MRMKMYESNVNSTFSSTEPKTPNLKELNGYFDSIETKLVAFDLKILKMSWKNISLITRKNLLTS